MSHHMQVGIPNLPLGTWWRTQSGGNGGHQSCPFNHQLYMYSCVCMKNIESSVRNTERRENREE